MPLSAVIDASVLVSAFLFSESVPGRVLDLGAKGQFAMWLSPILIERTRRSLLNPRLRSTYGHDETAVTAWLDDLSRTANVYSNPLPEIGQVCRDPDDDHVLAAAVATLAATIVTGDKDLLAIGQFRSIRIVTARVFLDTLSEA